MHGQPSDGNGAHRTCELPQGLEKIAAIAIRQMDVQHGNIRPRGARNVNCLTDAGGSDDRIALHPEQARHQDQRVAMVIHHKHGTAFCDVPDHGLLPIPLSETTYGAAWARVRKYENPGRGPVLPEEIADATDFDRPPTNRADAINSRAGRIAHKDARTSRRARSARGAWRVR